jgi:hypothetical protein
VRTSIDVGQGEPLVERDINPPAVLVYTAHITQASKEVLAVVESGISDRSIQFVIERISLSNVENIFVKWGRA